MHVTTQVLHRHNWCDRCNKNDIEPVDEMDHVCMKVIFVVKWSNYAAVTFMWDFINFSCNFSIAAYLYPYTVYNNTTSYVATPTHISWPWIQLYNPVKCVSSSVSNVLTTHVVIIIWLLFSYVKELITRCNFSTWHWQQFCDARLGTVTKLDSIRPLNSHGLIMRHIIFGLLSWLSPNFSLSTAKSSLSVFITGSSISFTQKYRSAQMTSLTMW